jgi:hypothetical protein
MDLVQDHLVSFVNVLAREVPELFPRLTTVSLDFRPHAKIERRYFDLKFLGYYNDHKISAWVKYQIKIPSFDFYMRPKIQ